MVGCGEDGTGAGDASVRVLLTDAPSDYIAEAQVDIGAVHLINDEDEPIVLTDDGTDGFVNLLELQGTATAALADLEIEADTYTQIRLIVEEAEVTLADGFEFTDQTVTKALQVPSGAQTGIKLNLRSSDGAEGGVEIAGGETVLVVDFDVNQSFVIQGNPLTPAGILGVLFTPTLRVIVDDVAGTISGTVSTSAQGVSVEGLVVTAEPDDEGLLEEFQTRTATAVTDADGEFTIQFVVPGDYTVSVGTLEGYTAATASVTVGPSAAITAVDFEIVAN
jgi:hypothetical protein